jgi:phosphohistidine phosphatase
MVYLVHHAEAAEPGIDPQRPLTESGRQHAERLAEEAARRQVRPVAIWHSGKLRARQTAQAFWRACNPLAELSAIRGLQPTDPVEWIRDRLLGEDRNVMVVGHMPHLPRLLEILTHEAASFPMHGLVAIEWDGAEGRESWRIDIVDSLNGD